MQAVSASSLHAMRRERLLERLPAVLAMGSAYHTGWMVLQLLGIISGLASERAYIVEHLRALARVRPVASVCIAGSADCGLLSVLHDAFGDEVQAMRVQVIDRSAVPLALCRRYAELAGIALELEQHDLCTPPGPGTRAVDLVLTHSLLSFIAPPMRAAMVSQLAARLGGGGRLLLYQSVRAEHGAQLLAYSPDQVDDMVSASLAAQRLPERRLVMLSDAELESTVRAFCLAKTTHAVASEAELAAIVMAAGMSSVRCARLFDQDLAAHRPATPASRYVKYVLHAERES